MRYPCERKLKNDPIIGPSPCPSPSARAQISSACPARHRYRRLSGTLQSANISPRLLICHRNYRRERMQRRPFCSCVNSLERISLAADSNTERKLEKRATTLCSQTRSRAEESPCTDISYDPDEYVTFSFPLQWASNNCTARLDVISSHLRLCARDPMSE